MIAMSWVGTQAKSEGPAPEIVEPVDPEASQLPGWAYAAIAVILLLLIYFFYPLDHLIVHSICMHCAYYRLPYCYVEV